MMEDVKYTEYDVHISFINVPQISISEYRQHFYFEFVYDVFLRGFCQSAILQYIKAQQCRTYARSNNPDHYGVHDSNQNVLYGHFFNCQNWTALNHQLPATQTRKQTRRITIIGPEIEKEAQEQTENEMPLLATDHYGARKARCLLFATRLIGWKYQKSDARRLEGTVWGGGKRL